MRSCRLRQVGVWRESQQSAWRAFDVWMRSWQGTGDQLPALQLAAAATLVQLVSTC